MNIKKNLFETKQLIKSSDYLTDRYILLNLTAPFFTGLEKITKNMPINNDLNDQVKMLLIKPLEQLENITKDFININPVLKYLLYFKIVELELTKNTTIKLKLQLKYYDFLMELLKENKKINVFIEKDFKNSPILIYFDNNLIMAIMTINY